MLLKRYAPYPVHRRSFECKSDGQYFAILHVSHSASNQEVEDSAYTGPVSWLLALLACCATGWHAHLLSLLMAREGCFVCGSLDHTITMCSPLTSLHNHNGKAVAIWPPHQALSVCTHRVSSATAHPPVLQVYEELDEELQRQFEEYLAEVRPGLGERV